MATVMVGDYGRRIPDGAVPEAERDEDGTVVVRWIAVDGMSSFTLTVYPNGLVYATRIEGQSPAKPEEN